MRLDRGLVIVGVALLAATFVATPTHAEPRGGLSAALGVGSSHPYRPGTRGAARTFDVSARIRAFEVAISTRNEGHRALAFEGTMSLVALGLTYHLSLPQADRFARAKGFAFLLLDLEPSAGLGLEGSYGFRPRQNVELGAYLGWHTDWYKSWGDGDPSLAGLTTGGEATVQHSVWAASVRLGLVALRQPELSARAGVRWHW